MSTNRSSAAAPRPSAALGGWRRRLAISALLGAGAAGLCAGAAGASDPVLEIRPLAVVLPTHSDLSPPLSSLRFGVPAALARRDVRREREGGGVGKPASASLPGNREGDEAAAARLDLASLGGLNRWLERLPPPSRVRLPRGGLLTQVAMPPLDWSADGIVDDGTVVDSTGDVGPNHFVHVSNDGIRIWSKEGTLLYSGDKPATLWKGFGGLCDRFVGDPYVLYDTMADRWLIAALAYENEDFVPPFYECVAVSTSGDPLGTWRRWSWAFERLNDFPKLGAWPGLYVMSLNTVPPPKQVVVFDRAAMLAGEAAPRALYFDLLEESFGNLQMSATANLDGPLPPPDGAPGVVIAIRDLPGEQGRFLDLMEVRPDWQAPLQSTLRRSLSLPLAPAAFRRTPFHQLGYRNQGAFESLVMAGEIYGEAGVALEWFHLRRRAGGTWTMWQKGLFDPDAGNEWRPAAALDAAGNLGLTWQHTEPRPGVDATQLVPRAVYAGRNPGDAAGMLRAPGLLMASS